MAGNKRGSAGVRVRKSAGTARFDRSPDHVLLTYTQNALFRFEPYVNPWEEGCPEE